MTRTTRWMRLLNSGMARVESSAASVSLGDHVAVEVAVAAVVVVAGASSGGEETSETNLVHLIKSLNML